MSSHDEPKANDELAPLRALSGQRGADAEDRVLARGLLDLYPPSPLATDTDAGWASIEAEAKRIAAGRRRRYLLGELISGVLPGRGVGGLTLSFSRVAAAAAILASLFVARDTALRPPPGPLHVTEARAALSHSAEEGAAREALLLDGAELRLQQGLVDIEQADPRQTRVGLRSGSVRLSVPRLLGPRRLSVATNDAEVIVHGTRFEVRKAYNATHISVEEGLVEVRPQGGGRPPVFLRPGERLTVPSLESYRADLSRRVAELVRDLRCDDRDHVLESYLSLATPGADTSAALYLRGACSARRGAPDEAILSFERAATLSADPVRADNALARAAQLRAARDPVDGVAAWRHYLLRFPEGLHRALARRHLAAQVAERR